LALAMQKLFQPYNHDSLTLNKQFGMSFTILMTKGEAFFVASIKEIPEVLSQGITVLEARENIIDALKLFIESEFLN
jgi:predicted RNase H-like HicB family nuclease